MVKLYKNNQPDGKGEIVVVTDAKDVRDFIPDLADATSQAIDKTNGQKPEMLKSIFVNAFDLAFKLAGYKAERVTELKVLTCGHSTPDACAIIADTSKEQPFTQSQVRAAEALKAGAIK